MVGGLEGKGCGDTKVQQIVETQDKAFAVIEPSVFLAPHLDFEFHEDLFQHT